MARTRRHLLVAAAPLIAALAGVPTAFACGSDGYSYAGLGARDPAAGMSAALVSVADFDVLHGHVAAYVGVGGPGQGPGGSSEWLQTGLSRFPGVAGSDVYYEVALPGRQPVYHQVVGGVPAGTAVDVAVREVPRRSNWWRIWVNGRAVSQAVHLPGSHDRWRPVATAEGWDGGTGGACNTFLYNFSRIDVEHRPGGSWHALSHGRTIRSSTTRLRRASGDAFVAAEGSAARRLLASLTP